MECVTCLVYSDNNLESAKMVQWLLVSTSLSQTDHLATACVKLNSGPLDPRSPLIAQCLLKKGKATYVASQQLIANTTIGVTKLIAATITVLV